MLACKHVRECTAHYHSCLHTSARWTMARRGRWGEEPEVRSTCCHGAFPFIQGRSEGGRAMATATATATRTTRDEVGRAQWWQERGPSAPVRMRAKRPGRGEFTRTRTRATPYWELYMTLSLTHSISALLLQPGLDVLYNMTTLWSRFLSSYLWHHR